MTSVDRIQGLSGSLAVKAPVRAATTAAITLSGEQTVDGVAVVEGDRVLVKDQASAVDNGIYDVSTGGWTRALDFNGSNDVVDGTLVVVTNGTSANLFSVSGTNPITPGTSAISILADRSFGQDGLPTVEVFDGGGSTFVLSQAAEVLANVELYISGVCQRPTTDFTYDNGTLTVTTTSATPAGTGNVMIRYNRLRAVGALEVTTLNKVAITQPANGATLTLIDGKTLTVNKTLTLDGTDGTVMTFPATSATLARIDAANTFVGTQTFSGLIAANLGLTVAGAAFNSRGITDSATAKALTLSGSGANSVTIANSATNPAIGTSAGDLQLMPASSGKVGIGGIPYSTLDVYGNITSRSAIINTKNGNSTISAISLDSSYASVSATSAGIAIAMSSNAGAAELRTDGTGTYDIGILTNATRQVHISHTASAVRYLTLTGAIAGGNPTIGTSAGSLNLSAAVICASTLSVGTDLFAAGYAQINSDDATPAGGLSTVGYRMGSAAVGIFFGSGAPTLSAPQGSLYIRTDGGASTRLYSNNNGTTGWSAITSA